MPADRNAMPVKGQAEIGRLLGRLAHASARWAAAILCLYLLLVAGAGWLTVKQLGVNTDTTDMLSAELPFRQAYLKYTEAFPDQRGDIIAVIEAGTPELARETAAKLAQNLYDQPTAFIDVQYPAGLSFFREHGLLYLSTEQLADLGAKLAEAQPLLAALAADPGLGGISRIVTDTTEAIAKGYAGEEELSRLDPLLLAVADTINRQVANAPLPLSWQQLLQADEGCAPCREVITIRPVLDPGALLPAARAIKAVRESATSLGLAGYGDEAPALNTPRILLTGEPVLAQEEMATVLLGAKQAGILSLVLVTLLLAFGLRSPSLIAAVFINLLIGLVLTAGLATIFVGKLNLISVAFAVLFVGLAVDFGIHFSLRYQEAMRKSSTKIAALEHAAGRHGVGVPLLLCAACTIIGFVSFAPTSYTGIAELGVISALGMAVALTSTLTLLPALLQLLPAPKPRGKQLADADGMMRTSPLVRWHKPVSILGWLLLVASLLLAASISFDVNPLHLRDPATESVSTFNLLAQTPQTTPYRIQLAARDEAEAQQLSRSLASAPGIGSTMSLLDFVPADQDAKLEQLFETALIIGPALSLSEQAQDEPDDAQRLDALEELESQISAVAGMSKGSLALSQSIQSYFNAHGDDPEKLHELDRLIGRYLPDLLETLQLGLNTGAVELTDLPESLTADWRGQDGELRIDVLPPDGITSNAALEGFAQNVLAVTSAATGTPIIVTEASRAIAIAFAEATALTLAAIILILLLVQRSLADLFLVLAPLVQAAALTVAAAVLLGQPFNFANVIALPLLFALGVCSSIHMVWRQRQLQRSGPESMELALSVEQTTTPRAITLSALTTVASFGSLAISPHPGTASMGLLLMLAIAMTLLTTLVFLPATMTWLDNIRSARAVRQIIGAQRPAPTDDERSTGTET